MGAGIMEEERYLSPKEAAALLGVSERRLQRAALVGSLPATRVCGRWRIKQSDLMLAMGRHQPSKPAAKKVRAWQRILPPGHGAA
jgi:excisionase family DNA binding protein